ncbi:MAG: hypothetical protein H3Z53_02860 [archaeon]|nr:hypothetical protein [archaeon]MCP8315363.1 hypothetical protein [archaeon]
MPQSDVTQQEALTQTAKEAEELGKKLEEIIRNLTIGGYLLLPAELMKKMCTICQMICTLYQNKPSTQVYWSENLTGRYCRFFDLIYINIKKIFEEIRKTLKERGMDEELVYDYFAREFAFVDIHERIHGEIYRENKDFKGEEETEKVISEISKTSIWEPHEDVICVIEKCPKCFEILVIKLEDGKLRDVFHE